MVATRTVTRIECPAEVQAATPAPIAEPAGAVLKFNAPGQAYLNDRFRREETLAGRLDAARAQCPSQ